MNVVGGNGQKGFGRAARATLQRQTLKLAPSVPAPSPKQSLFARIKSKSIRASNPVISMDLVGLALGKNQPQSRPRSRLPRYSRRPSNRHNTSRTDIVQQDLGESEELFPSSPLRSPSTTRHQTPSNLSHFPSNTLASTSASPVFSASIQISPLSNAPHSVDPELSHATANVASEKHWMRMLYPSKEEPVVRNRKLSIDACCKHFDPTDPIKVRLDTLEARVTRLEAVFD
ncbi:hypothetical protein BC830DRAFT_1172057 [Chytriomyces sp. MP71]|nr:hypothetical protein BC830DRAFT_1172057 [Chytriomyces sp. MP71]